MRVACVALALIGCGDGSSDRGDWAVSIRKSFDNAMIYAEGNENRTLVAEVDCERLLSWQEIGSLNNRGFRELRCQEWGGSKTYDLSKRLPAHPRYDAGVDAHVVVHDVGCPVAAVRLIKRMESCGFDMTGFTEDFFCAKNSKIDSRSVRMLADLKDCERIKALLNLEP